MSTVYHEHHLRPSSSLSSTTPSPIWWDVKPCSVNQSSTPFIASWLNGLSSVIEGVSVVNVSDLLTISRVSAVE